MLIVSIFLALIAHSLPAISGFNLDAGRGRITGGNVAREDQFPYQVGLRIETVSDQFTWCSGTLISDQWLLTAAHCVTNVISIYYYLGAVDRLAPQLLLKTDQSQSHIFVHPGWKAITLENDIALLRLPQAIPLSNSIKPIKLPHIVGPYGSYEYELATASGWGRTSDESAALSRELRYVLRYVDDNEDCQYAYGSNIRSTHICLDTTGGKSTCMGDSGGPLVYHDTLLQAEILIGLNSFGKQAGCTKGYPAVFTRITEYLVWIAEVSGVASR